MACEFNPKNWELKPCNGLLMFRDIQQETLVQISTGDMIPSIATMRVTGRKKRVGIRYCPACGTLILPPDQNKEPPHA